MSSQIKIWATRNIYLSQKTVTLPNEGIKMTMKLFFLSEITFTKNIICKRDSILIKSWRNAANVCLHCICLLPLLWVCSGSKETQLSAIRQQGFKTAGIPCNEWNRGTMTLSSSCLCICGFCNDQTFLPNLLKTPKTFCFVLASLQLPLNLVNFSQ